VTFPRPFVHHRPATLEEALRLAAEHGEQAKILAGGTELVPKMRRGAYQPAHLISVNGVAALGELSCDAQHGLRIGAGVRLSDVAAHGQVQAGYPALARACSEMATPQIRNMGTVAGNLVNGSPCADTAGPLLVYEASVRLARTSGQRELRLGDFFRDAGLVAIEPEEILVAIVAPVAPPGARSSFRRLSARSRVDVAAVSSTALLVLDPEGRIAQARVALGAVAPTPLRCPEGEQLLVGQQPSAELLRAAAERCAAAAHPIDDVRASAAYRRAVRPVLVRRVLEDCLAPAPAAAPPVGAEP
jgi:CO/xanthine dehydrogenase FAD-binding subunit